MTGRCPYCRSTRATQDDGAIVCEGCGAEFPTPDGLTPREREIVTLIRAGFTRHAIARILGIPEDGFEHERETVRATVQELCARFDCPMHKLPQAVARAETQSKSGL